MYSEAAKIVHCLQKAEKLSRRFEMSIEICQEFQLFQYKDIDQIYNKLFPLQLEPRGEKPKEFDR